MGQAGSQPAGAGAGGTGSGAGAGSVPTRARRARIVPHEPLRHAPKVLPSLAETPHLRSTNNGAILQSGGTISGRRPSSILEASKTPHGHVHSNVYRSRSAGSGSGQGEQWSAERNPLHRSHTNLDMRNNEGDNMSKRFGSEPNLRVEEEQQKPRCTRHFKKKYRAPPPPVSDNREGSSPDSSDGNARPEPKRKLRLFKTRNETKNMNGSPLRANGHIKTNIPVFRSTEYKPALLNDNQAFERRYRSPCKDKEQHFKYPDDNDMLQSTASLKKEERLLQSRQDFKKSRTDKVSGCRAKTAKTNEQSEAWKTPLLNRNFRYSERFKREDSETPVLRREKTFDNTLLSSKKESDSPKAIQNRIRPINHQLKDHRISPLAATSKPLIKSLPSLLVKDTEEKDELAIAFKKASNRIRTEIGSKLNVSENKTSQNEKTNAQKIIPTKATAHSKVKESSLKPSNFNNKQENKTNIHRGSRPVNRVIETKQKAAPQSNLNSKTNVTVSKYKFNSKDSAKPMPDRGQASGKESTPEHSPTRKKGPPNNQTKPQEKPKAPPAPSKQFYFGMIESAQNDTKDHLKDFPGLGSPIIEEISNFHLIEKKLLGYHDEDAEFEKFNAQLKENCKIKNLSSESALSSDASEGEESEGSLGIALRLRPTIPKKQLAMPRFSPAAAWRQLASLDAHLAAETQPLAVETKVSQDISPESSPRSDQSADKSGDSGISGDHAHSDPRIDSPGHHVPETTNAVWTPQQDLGDSSSDGAGGVGLTLHPQGIGVATYSPGVQPFSLSLPRENQDKGKQLQQGFNSLQKLKKSVSGAFGAALGSRRFDLEHEPMLQEPEQNWFLTKSAPNSLSNPLLSQPCFKQTKGSVEEDIKEEEGPALTQKEEPLSSWRGGGASYLSWGGHVMYLPPAPAAPDQPLSMLATIDRPIRSKSSGCLEVAARAARAARVALASEMRERERSASPVIARALPARVEPVSRNTSAPSRGKRFTFQSTVRQLERRKLAEKLSKEADLKEQQRRTELEAMRRVEEEFQRKRAREKANIRQQLRLVSSGAASMPTPTHHTKTRDEPDGSCRESPAPERPRDGRQRHSNASSEISGRSKSTTPVEWRDNEVRVYRDWASGFTTGAAHAHPPACARMPKSTHVVYNAAAEVEAFSGSPRSDNYRLEFARGRSPRTPRAPRLIAARTPSSSGSELSNRQPIKISESTKEEPEPLPEGEEVAIVPVLRPSRPARAPLAIR